jgi:hypothetical protein
MFHTVSSDALRAAGLTGGHVWVSFVDGALELRGDTGGVMRVGPSDLDHARIGYLAAKFKRYQALIWANGATEPLVLEPSAATAPAYTRAMLAFAHGCEDEGCIDRIERGSTKFEAVFPALLTVPIAVGVLGVEVFLLPDESWWIRALLPLVPLVLFGFLLRRGIAKHWPTRLQHSGDLSIVLPPLT